MAIENPLLRDETSSYGHLGLRPDATRAPTTELPGISLAAVARVFDPG
jgi:hypothetical protein